MPGGSRDPPVESLTCEKHSPLYVLITNRTAFFTFLPGLLLSRIEPDQECSHWESHLADVSVSVRHLLQSFCLEYCISPLYVADERSQSSVRTSRGNMGDYNSSAPPEPPEPPELVTEAPDWGDPPLGPEATAVPIVFALICVVGLAGNLLVIYVVWKYERMKSVTNYYIVNLAVADVAFLICCVPFSAAGFTTTSWHYGLFMCKFVFYFMQCSDFVCKFVFYFMQVTTMATCLTLAALSVDRYVAIVHPVSSLDRRTPTLAMAISAGIWIGSFLLSVPVAIYTELVKGFWFGPQVYCQEQWPSRQAELGYNIYTILISYVIPLLVSATSHTLIVCSLYKKNSVQPQHNQHNEEQNNSVQPNHNLHNEEQKNSVQSQHNLHNEEQVGITSPLTFNLYKKNSVQPHHNLHKEEQNNSVQPNHNLHNEEQFSGKSRMPDGGSVLENWAYIGHIDCDENNSVQPHHNLHNEEQALRKKKKVTRMVAVVVTLFAACWLPNHVINLVKQLNLVTLGYEMYCVKITALCLSYANSAANPFVYGFMGQNFRKSFKKAFPRCFHQNRVAVMMPDGARAGGSGTGNGSGNGNNVNLKPFVNNKVSTVEEHTPSV
ncbi:receptor [Branchiostoma belcheri]|nr:receptor [Branchiostoma belcheri]